jgi:inhibitor of KinA
MIKNISNLGDASLYCDFGTEVNKTINSGVIDYFNYLLKLVIEKKIAGINNLTPSYNKLIISFDLTVTNYSKLKDKIQNLKINTNEKKDSKKIKIPVCCDEKYGLDFDRLSTKLKLKKDEILKVYFEKEYFCYMSGFIAGMPFLGDIDLSIRCERLETPRIKVPEGSIGITEQFANIYTLESPGGWNIIGNTPKKVFDASNKESPMLINPGDEIKFFQISQKEYLNWNE